MLRSRCLETFWQSKNITFTYRTEYFWILKNVKLGQNEENNIISFFAMGPFHIPGFPEVEVIIVL